MKYYFNKIVSTNFDQTIALVTDKLKEEGFGVLTQIDVKDTLKRKLDVDFKRYQILGACNPAFAHRALLVEDKVGVMLPCNVVIEEHEDGKTEVTAIDPVTSMSAIDNKQLELLATEVRAKLKRVIDRL